MRIQAKYMYMLNNQYKSLINLIINYMEFSDFIIIIIQKIATITEFRKIERERERVTRKKNDH